MMEPQNALTVYVGPVMAERIGFEEFYRQDYRQVVGLAYVLLGNQWAAEEVAQEAFAAAYRRWSVVSGYDSPGAWVRRVVCNHAASGVRRRVREAKMLLKLRGITQRSALDESSQEFWQMVRTLPAKQAQAVALYYLEDLPILTIAEILHCSEGTVKTHLSRARQAIAGEVEQEDNS